MTIVHPPRLDDDEKRELFRDGYVVIKRAISEEMAEEALSVINGNLSNEGFANNRHPSTIGLGASARGLSDPSKLATSPNTHTSRVTTVLRIETRYKAGAGR